jgi:hypothetical protein
MLHCFHASIVYRSVENVVFDSSPTKLRWIKTVQSLGDQSRSLDQSSRPFVGARQAHCMKADEIDHIFNLHQVGFVEIVICCAVVNYVSRHRITMTSCVSKGSE